MQTLQQFREKFKVDELELFSTQDFTVSVRPTQVTLGSLIISSNYPTYSFVEFERYAYNTDLTNILSTSEKLLTKSYSSSLINVICLMLVDPIIHFHVFPRYESEICFYHRTWHDTCWPKPIDLSKLYDATPENILYEIRDDLKKLMDKNKLVF